MCLDFCLPKFNHSIHELTEVFTPLNPDIWDLALADHPDMPYASYIIIGLQEGFRVGFHRSAPLRSATSNMQSTRLRPSVIDERIADELSKGRMLGPFPPSWRDRLHINRFGLIPKGHDTGKFRLITDPSYPRGRSVNDGIDSDLTSLSYISVDNVAELVQQLGRGSLLAKVDIESAYRLVPVHPQDRILQAMEWKGNVYVDPMLPFGLRSAPKNFNAVADGLNWCLQQAGVRFSLHYLDDFIIVAPPQSSECHHALDILDPLAAHKRDGPTTCLIFLGIQIDTVSGELRLPQEKLQRLRTLLLAWRSRKSCQRKQLESLIGLLNHACKVVRSGRSFLRRLIDLLHSTSSRPEGSSIVRLSKGSQADIAWWMEFVAGWNGMSFLRPIHSLPTVVITSDASESWGCGAWYGDSWFQVPWDDRAQALSIAAKELVPIILACRAWGHAWHACQVRCMCDNQVVVAALRSRTTKDTGVMHLLRCLVFVEAQLGCHLYGEYLDTHTNHLADDLSRNRLFSFLSKVPSADHQPSPTSTHLLSLLLDPRADWMSPLWRRQFSATFKKD